MLFNTFQFALFMAVVLVLFRAVRRSAQAPVLLGASLIFYTLWIPAYLPLLLVDIGVNFLLLRAIARNPGRRLPLFLSVAFTLGLLAFFKYAAFLVESFIPLSEWTLGFAPPVPDILLPLGISFYSFQIVALAVDVHRGYPAPERLSRYALYIAFFPQLIAGPILRGSQFLPQLDRGAQPSAERTRRGIWLLASGLAKKVILADYLLAPFVDPAFDTPGLGNAAFHWVALYGFAFQIYFDFSGYTDMARGMALLLGFELPFNFTEPYLARNPREFWQRWHMTLSRWLGDYIYIPLGGNRGGEVRTYINITLTMVLGGLWHGAGWNFVAWGAACGFLLGVHRRFAGHGDEGDRLSFRDVPKIVVHLNLYVLTLVLFRSADLSAAWDYFRGLVPGGSELAGWPIFQCLVVLFCIGSHVVERWVRSHRAQIQGWVASRSWGVFAEAAALGLIVGAAVMTSGIGGEFIYFQF